MSSELDMGTKRDKGCERCPTGAGMWMATFSDMAILLMAMFVLLIALAETAKIRDTMFSVPGDEQSGYGTQDEVDSDPYFQVILRQVGKGNENTRTEHDYSVDDVDSAVEDLTGTLRKIVDS